MSDPLSDNYKNLPATTMVARLDNLYLAWTQICQNVLTSIGLTAPSDADIKEAAEIDVKDFKEACLQMETEFARTIQEWFLTYRKEMVEEKTKKYEALRDQKAAELKEIVMVIDKMSSTK